MSESAIYAALTEENRERCVPPLPDADVARIAKSVSRYAPGVAREDPPVGEEPAREAAEAAVDSTAQNPLPALEAQQRALGDLDALALHPRCVVENYLYADAGALVAPGGTGKTTLFLFEAIHVALGIPLYGLKVTSPGPVVVITAEDNAEVLYARLRELMAGLGLDDGQKTEALARIYIADLCGQSLRLLRRTEGVIRSTDLPDHIIERYGPINPAIITIDPTVSFGAGEQQYSNDDAQGLVIAARRIVRAIGCCVRFVHHTGKLHARDGALDQYAGRGGSALPDGCRMVAIMQPWHPDSAISLPLGVTPCPGEELMILARAKGSYHQPQPDIWIARRGWCFSHTHAIPVDADAERAALAEQLEQFLIVELRAGHYHTQNTLQDQGLMKRAPLRRAISDLTAARRVVYTEIPEARSRRGGAREYLHPVEFGAPAQSGPATEKRPETPDSPCHEETSFGGAPPYRDRELGAPKSACSLPPSPRCAGTAWRTNGTPGAPTGNGHQETTISAWLASIGETDAETIAEVLESCRRDPSVMAGYLAQARAGGFPL